MRLSRFSSLVLACLALDVAACRVSDRPTDDQLQEPDTAAIRSIIERYRTAWLKGDSAGVLATFTDDAVLLPHHGDTPVVGLPAIRAYWFAPGGPATTITDLQITVEQTGGNRSLAFARGHDAVAWTTTGAGGETKASNTGTYLNVMKRMPDRTWKIQAHMWDDPANVPTAAPRPPRP